MQKQTHSLYDLGQKMSPAHFWVRFLPLACACCKVKAAEMDTEGRLCLMISLCGIPLCRGRGRGHYIPMVNKYKVFQGPLSLLLLLFNVKPILWLKSSHIWWFWCWYIMVNSTTTELLNGACKYRRISKQMHKKHPFHKTATWKVWNFYENYITLFCVWKKLTFWDIILTQSYAWHITQSGRNNYLVEAAIKEQHHSVTCSV